MNIVLEILWLICRVLYADVEAFVKLFLPERPKSIRGKVAVVTGAGRGIGREIAIGLAKEGARVAVWDVDEDSAFETSSFIKHVGGSATAYKCDVTKTKDVAEVAAQVRRDLGEVEFLVNNAGVLMCKNILDLEEKDIRKTMEVNAISHFWTVKEFLPHMVSKNCGHIVIIASMAAKTGTPLLTDYCASKYAADGFSESLSADLHRMKKTGIRISTVYPMFVNTQLVKDHFNRIEMRDRFNPILTPESVASEVISGALRNHRYIYIPKTMGALAILKLLPNKAQLAILEFLDCGFFEK